MRILRFIFLRYFSFLLADNDLIGDSNPKYRKPTVTVTSVDEFMEGIRTQKIHRGEYS